jgi:carboxyl-terminal processing protease
MRAKDSSTFEVTDVIADSPASKVGLKAGDTILKVDQTDASAFTVATLRERLEKEPGTKIDLEVQDEGGVHEVVLVLEDLL